MAGSEPKSISASEFGSALTAAGAALSGGGGEGGPSSAASEAKQIAEGMAQIRSHLRYTGAALGAAATLVLGGLGWTQVHDAFPLPPGPREFPWWIWPVLLGVAIAVAPWRSGRWMAVALAGVVTLILLAVGGLVEDLRLTVSVQLPHALAVALALTSLMGVGGAAWLASRFFGAQRRILLETDPYLVEDLSREEEDAREHIYDSVANEESARRLLDVEHRALRLERVAARLAAGLAGAKTDTDAQNAGDVPPEQALKDVALTEAKRLQERVELGIYRTGLWILERRSKDAFIGKHTKAALVITVLGIVGTFGIADYAEGQRALVQLRATCQDAVAKGAVDACDPVRSERDKETVDKNKDVADKAAAEKLRQAELILGKAPTTTLEKIDWLEACVTVLGVEEPLKASPNLVPLCEASVPTK